MQRCNLWGNNKTMYQYSKCQILFKLYIIKIKQPSQYAKSSVVGGGGNGSGDQIRVLTHSKKTLPHLQLP